MPGLAAPTDAEISTWYDAHVADRFTQQAEVRSRHVLVKADRDADAATRDAARKKIEGLRRQIKDGAAFEKIAREARAAQEAQAAPQPREALREPLSRRRRGANRRGRRLQIRVDALPHPSQGLLLTAFLQTATLGLQVLKLRHR